MNSVSIIAQAAFGTKQLIDGVSTVADVKAKMNLGATYQATNKKTGMVLQDASVLADGDIIIFAEKVKGA